MLVFRFGAMQNVVVTAVPFPMRRLPVRAWFLLAALLCLNGCQTARFYRQAVSGQWEVLAGRESIEAVLVDPETPERLRAQLTLVQKLCRFAEVDLRLPARGQYTRYTDLGRPFVVWNIFAAPEFSLEAKSWWYPWVGRLDYRGYFHEELAMDYARELERRGYEVYVGGVDAYSTLGWFRDPVLNTFVLLPEAELADLLFHELAHQRLFIPGDTEVNEAFATAVAREGVRRWLAAGGSEGRLEAYLEERDRDDAVVAMIEAARRRLKELYAGAVGVPADEMRRRKAEVFAGLKETYETRKRGWPGYAGYDGWMAGPLNNARLNSVDAYTRWVPAMEVVLAGVGGDLDEFCEVMKRLRRGSRAERHAVLAWFEEQASGLKPRAAPSGPEQIAVAERGEEQHAPEDGFADLVAEQGLPQPTAQAPAEEDQEEQGALRDPVPASGGAELIPPEENEGDDREQGQP